MRENHRRGPGGGVDENKLISDNGLTCVPMTADLEWRTGNISTVLSKGGACGFGPAEASSGASFTAHQGLHHHSETSVQHFSFSYMRSPLRNAWVRFFIEPLVRICESC